MFISTCVLVLAFVITLALRRFFKHSPGFLNQGIPCLQPLFLLGHTHYVLFNNRKKLPLRNAVFHFLEAMAKIFEDKGLFCVTTFHKNYLILSSAEKAEAFLKTNIALNKASIYELFGKAFGDGILTSRQDKWKPRRRLLNSIFHEKNLESYQAVISKHASSLVEILNRSEENTHVDISCLLEEITFDIITDSVFGTAYSTTSLKLVPLAKIITTEIEDVADRMFLNIIPNFVYYLLPMSRKSKRDYNYMQDNITGCLNMYQIKEKITSDPICGEDYKHSSMFDFLKTHLKERNITFSFEDFKEELVDLVGGGFDSTKVSMEWLLLLIGNDERVQKKIHCELDDIFGNDKDAEITSEHLKQMEYLGCVIKETMRLFTPAPVMGRALTKDIIFDGYKISKGDEVLILLSAIHRNKNHYPEPNNFIPERFLKENSVGRHPYAFIPFSAGARNCIGNRYAEKTLKTITTQILRRFKITPLEAVDKFYMDNSIFAKPHKPILMRFQRRT